MIKSLRILPKIISMFCLVTGSIIVSIICYFRLVNPPYEVGRKWVAPVTVNGCHLQIDEVVDSMECRDFFWFISNYDPYPKWAPKWMKPRDLYGDHRDSLYTLSYPWIFPESSMFNGEIIPKNAITARSDRDLHCLSRIDVTSEFFYDSLSQLHFSPQSLYFSMVDSLRIVFGKTNTHYDHSTVRGTNDMQNGSYKDINFFDVWDLGDSGRAVSSLEWYAGLPQASITYTVTFMSKHEADELPLSRYTER